jgi:hypothetical protein
MNLEVERIIASELAAGERLLWSGQPRQGIRAEKGDCVAIPVSLMWCGFALFWEHTALTKRAPSWFPLWGAAFVGFGLYLVFGRFFVDALRRAKTFYGLTSRRTIIVSGLMGRRIDSIELDSMAQISLDEELDGSGTISLGAAAHTPRRGRPLTRSWPGARGYFPPALEMIENAREVYERILARQAKLKRLAREDRLSR